MAISDASRLADFATGVGTDGTLAAHNINATGVVTAVSFTGDGSKLTGVSGFATAMSATQGDFLNRVFVTPQVLPLGAGTSVSITGTSDNGNITFTRAGRIDHARHLFSGFSFIDYLSVRY